MRRWTSPLVALALLLALGPGTASATFLSGAIVFSTDADGNASGGQIWNALGGDGFFNLYLTSGTPAAPFLNSGNGAAASVNVALTPGTYTFALFGNPGGAIANNGINLFFNGANASPGLSAFAPLQSAGNPNPGFSVIPPGRSTLTLGGAGVGSSGSLGFDDGSTTVTLTDFQWATPAFLGLDRVSSNDNTPGGGNDFVGSISLSVTGVPEPSGLALVGLGAAVLLGYARRGTARRRPSGA
jgi:hypothetical protein